MIATPHFLRLPIRDRCAALCAPNSAFALRGDCVASKFPTNRSPTHPPARTSHSRHPRAVRQPTHPTFYGGTYNSKGCNQQTSAIFLSSLLGCQTPQVKIATTRARPGESQNCSARKTATTTLSRATGSSPCETAKCARVTEVRYNTVHLLNQPEKRCSSSLTRMGESLAASPSFSSVYAVHSPTLQKSLPTWQHHRFAFDWISFPCRRHRTMWLRLMAPHARQSFPPIWRLGR